MNKTIVLSILFLLAMSSFALADPVCGDERCDAGFLKADSSFEDMSSCFHDCQFSDWTRCDIDINGGSCVFNGKTFSFSNLQRDSCGAGGRLSLEIDYNGHSINKTGIEPQVYTSLADEFYIATDYWPCSMITTQQIIYLRGSVEDSKFNDILQPIKEIDLKRKDNISIDFDLKNLFEPYIRFVITNDEDKKELVSSNGLSLSDFNTELDPTVTKPGIYTADLKLFDTTGNNLIAQQSSKIVIHECLANNECGDGMFWTKNVCSGEGYNVCSNPLNWILIGLITGGVLALIIIFLIFRQKKP